MGSSGLSNESNGMPINASSEFTPNGHRQNGKNSTALGQWTIISALIKDKRGPIESERRLLEEGLHPKYLSEIEQCDQRYAVEMQRINAAEKDETARFEEAYQQELVSLEKEYENRVNELVGSIWQEVEDKHLDGELSELNRWEGVKWSNANNIQYVQSGQGAPGKKQLRRRPYEPNVSNINATSAGPSNSSIEQNSSGPTAEKKARKRSPGASQIYPLVTQTLLSPQTINADLAKFCPNINDPNRHSSTSKGSANYATISNGPTSNSMDHHIDVGGEKDALGRKRKVVLEEGKLICDGKTFYRTQNVSIKSDNTGGKLLQARIMQINDLTVHFRSVIPGDTRVFVASKEDLEKSIITVYKRY